MQRIGKGAGLAGLAAVFLMSAAGFAFADPVTVNFLTAEKPETFAT